MNSTGIVRGVDHLGRLVIPKEIRTRLGVVDNEDAFEVYMDGNKVVLVKYEPTCIFCGDRNNVFDFNGKKVCQKCAGELTRFI